MNNITTACKKNGVRILLQCDGYGNPNETKATFQYTKGHPCNGCPYTVQTTVLACMFPERTDGSCFWYDLKGKRKPTPQKTERQEAADRIFQFIKVLNGAKQRKGYK
jgi:hypothetical protein